MPRKLIEFLLPYLAPIRSTCPTFSVANSKQGSWTDIKPGKTITIDCNHKHVLFGGDAEITCKDNYTYIYILTYFAIRQISLRATAAYPFFRRTTTITDFMGDFKSRYGRHGHYYLAKNGSFLAYYASLFIPMIHNCTMLFIFGKFRHFSTLWYQNYQN